MQDAGELRGFLYYGDVAGKPLSAELGRSGWTSANNWQHSRRATKNATKKEELLGRRIPEILNSGVFETTIKEKLDECFQGKIVRYEMRYTYPSRGERDLFVSYSPIEGPGGIDGVACVLQDITDRKRANEALEESESRFRAVYERSPVGIALVDAGSGRFLEVNPKFCEILGRTEEEMLQLDFQSVTHPDDVAKSVSKRKELFEGRSAHFELEKRYLRRDGGEVWANVSVAPMWREQEPQKVYLVMAQDMSDRKRAEEALLRSEASLNRAQAVGHIGSWRFDIQKGRVTWSDHRSAVRAARHCGEGERPHTS